MGKLTQYDYLKGELVTFSKQKEDLTQKVKSFCQNKEYPLDDRWKLFIESNLGEHQDWFLDLDIINLDDYYDGRDRYQEFSAIDIIYWLDDHAYTNIDEAKEEILKSLFFEYYMTKEQWYGFLKEVNRKMNYGINALEHDLTRKFNRHGEFITSKEIDAKLDQMKRIHFEYLKTI